jgi:hypothetical protein
MLTNKYYEPKTITLEHGLSMFGREAHITTIDHTGMHSSVRTLSSFSTEFVMQGFSVTMITMP